jgi:hypothetical protein
MNTKYHQDGTVTYWSVYQQQWVRAHDVPARELAAMDAAERACVKEHIRRNGK